jgi:hypothetical protein
MIVIFRRVLITAIKVSGIGTKFVIRSVVVINVDSLAVMWTVITVVILVWTMVNVVRLILMFVRRISVSTMMIYMMWNMGFMMVMDNLMALLSVIAVITIEIVSWLLELMLPEIVRSTAHFSNLKWCWAIALTTSL